jgi:hypothetical protein
VDRDNCTDADLLDQNTVKSQANRDVENVEERIVACILYEFSELQGYRRTILVMLRMAEENLNSPEELEQVVARDIGSLQMLEVASQHSAEFVGERCEEPAELHHFARVGPIVPAHCLLRNDAFLDSATIDCHGKYQNAQPGFIGRVGNALGPCPPILVVGPVFVD